MEVSNKESFYDCLDFEEFEESLSEDTQLDARETPENYSSFKETVLEDLQPIAYKRNSTSTGNSGRLVLYERPVASVRRRMGNFHDNYLEMGMWPELSYQKSAEIARKYRTLKEEYNRSVNQIRTFKKKTKKIPCLECKELKITSQKTKTALQEAVQLTNLMLKEIQRLDKDNKKCFV